MSRFTTEVRYICETMAGHNESVGYNDISSTITTAAPLLFNFDFPIFDEAYRLPLETKILRHFYTREICEETVGLWKLRLEDKLNLIMPYYNQLYRSELLEFNPMYDVDVATDHTKNANSESNKTATGTTKRVMATLLAIITTLLTQERILITLNEIQPITQHTLKPLQTQ